MEFEMKRTIIRLKKSTLQERIEVTLQRMCILLTKFLDLINDIAASISNRYLCSLSQ